MKVAIVIMIVICSIMFAGAQACWKTGLQQRGFSLSAAGLMSMAGSPLIWAGFVIMGIATVLWFAVLSRADLSFAYPLVSLSYVFGLLVSKYVFHETIGFVRWLGVLLICIGAGLIAGRTG